jgi:hypothetical protein
MTTRTTIKLKEAQKNREEYIGIMVGMGKSIRNYELGIRNGGQRIDK